jgi:hypothetical protein
MVNIAHVSLCEGNVCLLDRAGWVGVCGGAYFKRPWRELTGLLLPDGMREKLAQRKWKMLEGNNRWTETGLSASVP